MRDEQLGLGILSGSSCLAGALCAALLVVHWPPSPPKLDPVEQVRRLQLGPSSMTHLSGLGARPTSWDSLVLGDVRALRRYARIEPRRLGDAGFRWLGSPRPGSWQEGAGRREHHQDFLTYVEEQREMRSPWRRALVLRPVDTWPEHHETLAPEIARFVRAFFQRPVRWERPLFLLRHTRLIRGGVGGRPRYPAEAVLSLLRRDRALDALAVVGITTADRFFGLADLKDRVAVVSSPRQWSLPADEKQAPDARKLMALRLFRLLAHEIGHTLGVRHCVAFRCLMNGCNNLSEHDSIPLFLCPICLAKLAWRLSWDITARYEDLAGFLESRGHLPEARWYRAQLARLGAGDEAPRSIGTLQ